MAAGPIYRACIFGALWLVALKLAMTIEAIILDHEHLMISGPVRIEDYTYTRAAAVHFRWAWGGAALAALVFFGTAVVGLCQAEASRGDAGARYGPPLDRGDRWRLPLVLLVVYVMSFVAFHALDDSATRRSLAYLPLRLLAHISGWRGGVTNVADMWSGD